VEPILTYFFPFTDEPAIGVDIAKITESEKKDVQFHIQEEDHGVGWCAKIVFFTLMAILAGLVVLIVLENRGGSDRECIELVALTSPNERIYFS
jgi:aspartate beta-hydroxylase